MTAVPEADTDTLSPTLEEQLESAQVKIANLEVALANARTIGAAIGVLVERHKISVDEAFGTLVRASQRDHRKLHAIAFDLVATGEAPDLIA